MTYLELPFIQKVTENQQAFGEKVIKIANELGFLPHWLMIVMNNESGLNHRIENFGGSGATGLIQFMPATAKELGTTTTALKAMTNLQQLDYVKKYLTMYGYHKRVKDVADLYLSVFFPLALYRDDSFVFPKWASDANKIFDVNKDGTLTKAEFKDYVNKKYAEHIPKEATEALAAKKKIKTVMIVVIVLVVVAVAAFAIYKFRKK